WPRDREDALVHPLRVVAVRGGERTNRWLQWTGLRQQGAAARRKDRRSGRERGAAATAAEAHEGELVSVAGRARLSQESHGDVNGPNAVARRRYGDARRARDDDARRRGSAEANGGARRDVEVRTADRDDGAARGGP